MRRQPVDRDGALALGRQARRILHKRARKMEALAVAGADEAALEAALVGRSGNLRAPVLVAGKTIVAGFDAAAYRDALGL